MGDNIWSRGGGGDYELACPNCGATLVNGRCAECRTVYRHDEGRTTGTSKPEPIEPAPPAEAIESPAERRAAPSPRSVIEFDGLSNAVESEPDSRPRWSAVLAVAVVLLVAVGLTYFVRGSDGPPDEAPRFGTIRSPERLEQLYEYRTSGAVSSVAGSIDTTFVLMNRDRDNVIVLNADWEEIGRATVPGRQLQLDAYGDIAVVYQRGKVRAIDATGATLWETEGDTAEFVAENEVLVYNDRPDSPVEDYEVFGARSGRTLRELATEYKVPTVDAEFFADRRRGEVELFDRRLRLIQSFSALETNRWYYDGEYMVTATGNRLRAHSLTGVSRECALEAMDTISEVMPVDVGEYVVNGYSKDPDPESDASTQVTQRVTCTGNAGAVAVLWSESNAWTAMLAGDLTNVQRHGTHTFQALKRDGSEVGLDVEQVFEIREVARDTYAVWVRPVASESATSDSTSAMVRRLVRIDDKVEWAFDYPDERGEKAWMIDGAVVAADETGGDTTLRLLGDG